MDNRIVKIAIAGAILAIATDYFIRPTLNKNLGLNN